jgi:hypothetical protein
MCRDESTSSFIRVTDFEEHNHMTAEALAIVFSPNLLRAPQNDFVMILANMGHTHKLVKALITHVIIGPRIRAQTADFSHSSMSSSMMPIRKLRFIQRTSTTHQSLKKMRTKKTKTLCAHLNLLFSKNLNQNLTTANIIPLVNTHAPHGNCTLSIIDDLLHSLYLYHHTSLFSAVFAAGHGALSTFGLVDSYLNTVLIGRSTLVIGIFISHARSHVYFVVRFMSKLMHNGEAQCNARVDLKIAITCLPLSENGSQELRWLCKKVSLTRFVLALIQNFLTIFIMSLKVPKANNIQIFKDGYKVGPSDRLYTESYAFHSTFKD